MNVSVPVRQPVQPASPALYLDHAEQLRGEIEQAMALIAGNRLGALEESLWRQQVLCASLKHLGQAISAGPMEHALEMRLREANLALQEVNRTYAHLVAQSSSSNDLLLRLCRSYKEAAPFPSTTDEPRSWSCEA